MTEDRKDVKIDASFILRADWIWLWSLESSGKPGNSIPDRERHLFYYLPSPELEFSSDQPEKADQMITI